jgi:galactokinase
MKPMPIAQDNVPIETLLQIAQKQKINVKGGKIRRTSSRFCFGVEHGDYNGTELFGVGTDRFIWIAYKPATDSRMRLFSGNFPNDGVIEFQSGNIRGPKSQEITNTWGRFAYGVDFVLHRAGYKMKRGINAVIFGNIPGGGMSRSASLTLNLILSALDANDIEEPDKMKIVDLAQQVENDYIGSPCGKLDQIMLLFAREGFGTYYNPKDRKVEHIPLGKAELTAEHAENAERKNKFTSAVSAVKNAEDFAIVIMDTGTVRPGLEKSTYKIRRTECEQFVSILQKAGFKISCLADVKTEAQYEQIMAQFSGRSPDLCDRFRYIYNAQKRFYEMLNAWKRGDIETVGRIFREDGIGLRDDYKISGPELETMCDIARTVAGCLGERMLGGGDKGAAGAIVKVDSVNALKKAIDAAYPRKWPALADKYAVHICKIVDGVKVFFGLLDY